MDYRRFFRQAMMLTITTGLLASCSKDNNVGEPEADEQLVSISPGIALSAKANGDTDGISSPAMNQVVEGLTFSFLRADDDGWGFGDFVFSSSPEHITGTCETPYMDENLQAIVAPIKFNPTQYYLSNGYKSCLWGWYPQTNYRGINNGQVQVLLSFDGKTDVMLANAESGSKTELIENFQFYHVLTQLQFQARAVSEIAAQQWGSITEISLENENTEYRAIFRADASNPTTDFRTPSRLTSYLPETEISLKYGEDIKAGMIMVEPRTISSEHTINLKITTTGKGEMTEAINLNDFINGQRFEAGYAYTLTLRFLQDEVEIKVTPADWRTPAGEVDVEVGNEYPYIKDGKYIISGDLLGSTGETFHDKWTATEVNTDETCVSASFEIAESDATVDESSEVNWYIATGTHDETYNPDTKNACPEGWRLPTIKELELIETFNARLTHPLTENSGYWSATESAEDDGQAHILENNGGLDRQTTKSTVGKVRCVRDI